MSIRRLTELALLSSVALIMFVIELRIPNPFPIPGVKLGLANIVTVYAVFRYRPSETAMIVTVRLLLGSMFSGNPSALLYSAAGAVTCLCGMLLLRRALPENAPVQIRLKAYKRSLTVDAVNAFLKRFYYIVLAYLKALRRRSRLVN